jgi:hypothetical protein
MLHYETDYVFQWTYHKPKSMCCYTETKHFSTELERNKFALEWFSKDKQGEIVLEFAQQRNLQTWRK